MGKASARQDGLKVSGHPPMFASRDGLSGCTKRSVPIDEEYLPQAGGVPDNRVGHEPSSDAVRATRQCYPEGSPALTASYGFA